jgi:hypothetical protein
VSTIQLRHGTEGPKNDPYSYTEVTVIRGDSQEVVFHEGLGNFVATPILGRIDEHEHPDGIKGIRKLFEVAAGVTVQVAISAYYESKSRPIRFHACGQRHLQTGHGFPGETLVYCTKCNTILASEFDEDAII